MFLDSSVNETKEPKSNDDPTENWKKFISGYINNDGADCLYGTFGER